MDLSKPILLFDCSYVVFYRYYAITGWYKRALEQDIPVADILTNEDFMSKYDASFEKMILEFTKKNKVPMSNVLFARDCSRDKIWRTSLFPEYKAGRDERASSFNGDIFKHTYDVLFPKLKTKYNFHSIMNNQLEADDLIAVIVKYIRDTGLHTGITIVTNDNDYVQLYKHNVKIVNLQNKDLAERIRDVENYLEYKIIVGDKSDNIKAIGKKIGEKTAQKMMLDKDVYDKYMSVAGVQEQYDLNRTLIDFDCIPVDLQLEAQETFKHILRKL